ncbi:MAG TPA: HAMP domain-containing sensor histidine kinase [Gaiellaceae bacterium]|nr:HAMP domain-containing sensor histidine kinase [Gaiellaceae bacterium]
MTAGSAGAGAGTGVASTEPAGSGGAGSAGAGAGISLRARLFAATLAALALTLALTIAIGAVLTRRQVDRSQAADVARRADDLALQRRQHVSYTIEDVVAGSVRIMIQSRASFASIVPNVNRSSDGTVTYVGERQLYSYRTLPHLGLLLIRPASVQSAAWRPFLGDLLLAALAGALFAAVVSFVLARSIVRPIRRVADATHSIAAGDEHDPLPTTGSRELAALAAAFNRMAEQLAASREAERAFLLSVSHELKTPLTAIRGYAEGLADGAFGPDEAARTIGVEAGRLERLVRDLLDLARMNRVEFAVRSEPVDLAAVARDAVLRHEGAARAFGVELHVEGTETWVEADQDRVLQVASNLVENALRETPAGGAVTVSAEPGRLVVADTGPGIPVGDVPHAFERFYLYDKIGKDRPVGSGLGLAIVKQLVTAMRGDVRVESGAGGTTFTVELRAQLDRVRAAGPEPSVPAR